MKILNYDNFVNENFNKNIYEGEYTILEIQQNRLKISLTIDGKEKINDISSDVLRTDDFFDFVEDIVVNSDFNYVSDIGEVGLGLTSAPGFIQGYTLNDDGIYDDVDELYYYNDYMILSFMEQLQKNGVVYFDKAENVNESFSTLERPTVNSVDIKKVNELTHMLNSFYNMNYLPKTKMELKEYELNYNQLRDMINLCTPNDIVNVIPKLTDKGLDNLEFKFIKEYDVTEYAEIKQIKDAIKKIRLS